jgi:hypothetical protein
VEWAHAMAPKANIILVEADDLNNLFIAAEGRHFPECRWLMSFGSHEFSGQTSIDPTFAVPGVTSSPTGDAGAPGVYPATRPTWSWRHVVISPTIIFTTTKAGRQCGAMSEFEPQPSYQTSSRAPACDHPPTPRRRRPEHGWRLRLLQRRPEAYSAHRPCSRSVAPARRRPYGRLSLRQPGPGPEGGMPPPATVRPPGPTT